MKRRIYLSGAFTNVNSWNQTSKNYAEIGRLLYESDFDVYLPHTKTPPTLIEGLSTEDIFLSDFKEIKNSHIVLAMLDNPSHGVGAEIAIALELGLIVVGTAYLNTKISRFVLGLLQTHKNGYFFTYETISEIPSKFNEILNFKDIDSNLFFNHQAQIEVEQNKY